MSSQVGQICSVGAVLCCWGICWSKGGRADGLGNLNHSHQPGVEEAVSSQVGQECTGAAAACVPHMVSGVQFG